MLFSYTWLCGCSLCTVVLGCEGLVCSVLLRFFRSGRGAVPMRVPSVPHCAFRGDGSVVTWRDPEDVDGLTALTSQGCSMEDGSVVTWGDPEDVDGFTVLTYQDWSRKMALSSSGEVQKVLMGSRSTPS